VLTQAAIQAALVALQNQKNLQGIKMQVSPSRLILGPQQQFDASVLLNSAFYPSGAAAAGAPGGAFAINPIKGILDMTVSRFVFKNDGTVSGDSKAWYVVDDSKPWFVLQMREAVTVEQEATNAGDAFNRDVMRFKARSRMNADFLDPRFAWQGNDGSVTS
jgi:phage major head subunit gpT-like protein